MRPPRGQASRAPQRAVDLAAALENAFAGDVIGDTYPRATVSEFEKHRAAVERVKGSAGYPAGENTL